MPKTIRETIGNVIHETSRAFQKTQEGRGEKNDAAEDHDAEGVRRKGGNQRTVISIHRRGKNKKVAALLHSGGKKSPA